MLPSALNLRLQHLEASITRSLNLINEYQIELDDEDEPNKRSKYRRRIEQLNQSKDAYEQEFTELQVQLFNNQPVRTENISTQLQKMDEKLFQLNNKLNNLSDDQSILHKVLISYFNTDEQILLRPFTHQLNEEQVVTIQATLEAIDDNQISEDEVYRILTDIRKLLMVLQDEALALPMEQNAVIEMLNTPNLDAKHALKVSVPIVPFILSYEGELGLGAGLKLKETWEYWKSKFWKNR